MPFGTMRWLRFEAFAGQFDDVLCSTRSLCFLYLRSEERL